jgi:tetratricopeptide (TPR) repeat protein
MSMRIIDWPASMLGRPAVFVVLAATALAPYVSWRGTSEAIESEPMAPVIGMPGAPPTSPDGLRRRIDEMEKALGERPDDTGPAILLADALLRQGRVTGDGRLAHRAENVLTAVLKRSPGQYDALRLLSTVRLSQHRFRDALETAERAREMRPDDAWNHGVIGDASIELGEYDAAFAAFDAMMKMKPNAAAYSRVAYARELKGNLRGALEAMEMAVQATSPHDPEALAWNVAHVGELHLRMGNIDDADREFRRAAFVFPDYPLAMIGQGKVLAIRGDRDGALGMFLHQFTRTPSLELAARIGDLHLAAENPAEAERFYQLAEELAGPAIAQTEAALALFLAERDRKLGVAVTIAETVSKTRRDIFTDDALAWAYYKTGRLDEAAAASKRARRTGTKDENILTHAVIIQSALGRRERS